MFELLGLTSRPAFHPLGCAPSDGVPVLLGHLLWVCPSVAAPGTKAGRPSLNAQISSHQTLDLCHTGTLQGRRPLTAANGWGRLRYTPPRDNLDT